MIVSRPKTVFTAAVLFLLAIGAAPSTQAQIREPARSPVPRVTLNVSSTSLAPGSRVTFAAQLSSGYPNIRFRFDFGDGAQSGWQPSAVATHTYHTAGNYLPFVDIGVASGGAVTRVGGSVRRRVHVAYGEVGPADFSITPSGAETGRSVTMMVRSTSSNPNLRYRFSFGDGSPASGWQSNPQVSHLYSKPGTYIASVDVGLMTNRGVLLQGTSRRGVSVSGPAVLTSRRTADTRTPGKVARVTKREHKAQPAASKTTAATIPKAASSKPAAVSPASAVTPAPTSSPQGTPTNSGFPAAAGGSDDLRYLWLLVPLALLVFVLGKWIFAQPKAVSHADPGTARVVDATGLVKNTEVITPPRASQSHQEVSSGEPLAKNVRSENG